MTGSSGGGPPPNNSGSAIQVSLAGQGSNSQGNSQFNTEENSSNCIFYFEDKADRHALSNKLREIYINRHPHSRLTIGGCNLSSKEEEVLTRHLLFNCPSSPEAKRLITTGEIDSVSVTKNLFNNLLKR